MARAGRKRKAGFREPNGRLQRPTTQAMLNDQAAKLREKEQSVVLMQPHRRGETHAWAESPLGRLCLRNKLRPEMYGAGMAYAAVVGCWRSAKGIPSSTGCRTEGGSGGDVSEFDVRRWRSQMLAMQRAVSKHGIEALLTLNTLVLDEADPGIERDNVAIVALQAVAVENGTMREHCEPFAS